MTDDQEARPLIQYAHHRALWEQTRDELRAKNEPAKITIRATVNLLHDMLKEARTRNHVFRSDEAKPMGGDEAANPLSYFVAAVGF